MEDEICRRLMHQEVPHVLWEGIWAGAITSWLMKRQDQNKGHMHTSTIHSLIYPHAGFLHFICTPLPSIHSSIHVHHVLFFIPAILPCNGISNGRPGGWVHLLHCTVRLLLAHFCPWAPYLGPQCSFVTAPSSALPLPFHSLIMEWL